jgi:hypothetical protein
MKVIIEYDLGCTEYNITNSSLCLNCLIGFYLSNNVVCEICECPEGQF